MNEIEKSVQSVYNSISDHFSHTRHYLWPSVKEFLESLPVYSIVGDIGCGNGKNMDYLSHNKYYFIGMDFSEKFLEICTNKQLEVMAANNYNIPIKTNSLDHCISIAVIHHLATEENRIQCINELLRITNFNGSIMIQVWAFEREFNKSFESQDASIPWRTKEKVYNRYYYLFKKNELDNLIKKSNYKTKIEKSYKERDNYIVIVKKLM